MTTSPDRGVDAWIAAIRASHDRLTGLLGPLDGEAIRGRSYDTDWSIAQVASHLGSQAEIFDLFLRAGLDGGEMPGSERFQQIWGRWDGSTPEQQVRRSIEANETFVSAIEGLTPEQRDGFHASLFGNTADLAGLLAMRLSEHALHTWDVAVALDPTAEVAPDAVALLVETVLPGTVSRAGRPADPPQAVAVTTRTPDLSFALTTGPTVSLTDAGQDGAGADGPGAEASLEIPAEAFLRLVYGRLDADHTPAGLEPQEELLGQLRQVFPGF